MFDWFYKLFSPNDNPDITQSLIVLLIAISVGFFVGRIKIRNVSLGVSAVMFVGLFLGHYVYRMDESILLFARYFGIILFLLSSSASSFTLAAILSATGLPFKSIPILPP